MSPEARARLRIDIMSAEGCRLKPYRDTVGKLTIGFGRNIEDVGISTLEAEVLLDHDLFAAEQDCRRAFPWFGDLNDARQRAIAELCFNMGLNKLQEFKKMLAAMVVKDYPRAASEALDSTWAKQVGTVRSNRIAAAIRDGR